jgi:hypothetical protein
MKNEKWAAGILNCSFEIRNLKFQSSRHRGRRYTGNSFHMHPGTILKFDRTPVARLISCAAVFGSAALLFDYLSHGISEIEILPFAALLLLFVGTLVAAAVQYGDHIYVSDDGVLYENRVLSLFGKRGRWRRWEEGGEVREIKRKVLILLSHDGRRVLVDAILGYPIARSEILRHAPHAVVSGTLAPDEA